MGGNACLPTAGPPCASLSQLLSPLASSFSHSPWKSMLQEEWAVIQWRAGQSGWAAVWGVACVRGDGQGAGGRELANHVALIYGGSSHVFFRDSWKKSEFNLPRSWGIFMLQRKTHIKILRNILEDIMGGRVGSNGFLQGKEEARAERMAGSPQMWCACPP